MDTAAHAEQLERAAEFFRERDTYEGVLARRVFGEPTSYDRELADHLIRGPATRRDLAGGDRVPRGGAADGRAQRADARPGGAGYRAHREPAGAVRLVA